MARLPLHHAIPPCFHLLNLCPELATETVSGNTNDSPLSPILLAALAGPSHSEGQPFSNPQTTTATCDAAYQYVFNEWIDQDTVCNTLENLVGSSSSQAHHQLPRSSGPLHDHHTLYPISSPHLYAHSPRMSLVDTEQETPDDVSAFIECFDFETSTFNDILEVLGLPPDSVSHQDTGLSAPEPTLIQEQHPFCEETATDALGREDVLNTLICNTDSGSPSTSAISDHGGAPTTDTWDAAPTPTSSARIVIIPPTPTSSLQSLSFTVSAGESSRDAPADWQVESVSGTTPFKLVCCFVS